jgi:hypothetical protein
VHLVSRNLRNDRSHSFEGLILVAAVQVQLKRGAALVKCYKIVNFNLIRRLVPQLYEWFIDGSYVAHFSHVCTLHSIHCQLGPVNMPTIQ